MRKLLAIVLVVLFASGCGVLYRQPIYQGNLLDKTAVDQLQQGMDKRQVMTLLGTPSVRDPFHQNRWDYVATRRTGRTCCSKGTITVGPLTIRIAPTSTAIGVARPRIQ